MMPSRHVLAGALLLAATLAAPSAAQTPSLPKVLVIGTGGTISGEQAQPGTLSGYEMKRSANDLVAAVPVIALYAEVETEQFGQISSPDITPEHWIRLANRINEVFGQRPDLSGIVVTHGTARLEETAFFLYLTVKSDRPVVMAAAQRPATGISADGPLNVLSAIRVAGSPAARGMGAMVVMDNRILSARDVKKAYARSGGFETGEMGMLGVVANRGAEFYYAPAKKHTHRSDFDVARVTTLPRVGMTYSFAGSDGEANGGVSPRDEGIVVATTGFTPAEEAYYAGLRARGVIVATTFPSGEQVGGGGGRGDDPNPGIGVGHLSPLKARILLMLALTRTRSAREIQAIFDAY
jgi:L-asparaginase type II